MMEDYVKIDFVDGEFIAISCLGRKTFEDISLLGAWKGIHDPNSKNPWQRRFWKENISEKAKLMYELLK